MFGILVVLFFSVSVFSSTVTSWDFELYNVPYAEQAALSIAQQQRSLEQKDQDNSWEQSSMEMFKDMLERRILSEITEDILDNMFPDDQNGGNGGNGSIDGEYPYFNISHHMQGDTLIIDIEDLTTGETTTIEIPNYNYSSYSSEE